MYTYSLICRCCRWIRYGEGFFLVYSIIHRPSFERELTPLITQLKVFSSLSMLICDISLCFLSACAMCRTC